tara:strand:- start:263 stop:964 length:702 start_codon:yes stop_codon:yes gene_type:complete
MKTIILCGGLGTRLSEETKLIPKPMVKIGNKPILCHIMDIYFKYGFKDFILATGYKSEVIKNFFKKKKFKYNIKIVNTGQNTLTGGRLLRLKKLFRKNENFMLTYGDGVSNHNIKKLLKFHLLHKKIATVTAVRPPVRFGELYLNKNTVKRFREKQQVKGSWINGGFFVFNTKIFKFINGDQIMLERSPLERLSKKKNLIAYKHDGFWQCMDTMRDKNYLNSLIKNKKAPWIN